MRITFVTFSSIGAAAALFFILIIIVNAVTGAAHSVVQFIENYYVIIGIILFVIITGICIGLYVDSPLPLGFKVVNFIASEAALIQSGVFLVYGLYGTLKMYPKNAFMTIGTFGVFVLLFIIDLAVTFAAVTLTMEKQWGSVVMVLVAVLGLWLTLS